jgi:hypothetical protein
VRQETGSRAPVPAAVPVVRQNVSYNDGGSNQQPGRRYPGEGERCGERECDLAVSACSFGRNMG